MQQTLELFERMWCKSVSELANVYLVYCFHLMLSLLLASMESHYFTAYRMD